MLNYTTNETNRKSGNKCGHCPSTPRFFKAPEDHGKRPLLLLRFIIVLLTYYPNPTLLPLLNAVNGSTRQQRSERREACLALLCCILHYTELATLRVGIPQADGSMAGLTMPYLAKLAGLGERRAERAMHDLVAAGILTVHTICVKISDTVYKGVAAIRTVSEHLFTALGFGAWLRHERRKAAERKAKKDKKRNQKNAANIQMGLNALNNKKQPKTETEPEIAVTRNNKMATAAEYLANIKNLLKPDTG